MHRRGYLSPCGITAIMLPLLMGGICRGFERNLFHVFIHAADWGIQFCTPQLLRKNKASRISSAMSNGPVRTTFRL